MLKEQEEIMQITDNDKDCNNKSDSSKKRQK